VAQNQLSNANRTHVSLRTALGQRETQHQCPKSKHGRRYHTLNDISDTEVVKDLRSNLRRVQQEAEAFRADLDYLRAFQRPEVQGVQHDGGISYLETKQAGFFKLQEEHHKAECKGLLVQITYLQDKWRREAAFRDDLCFTKAFLISSFAAEG
jgi:hypothetical protein